MDIIGILQIVLYVTLGLSFVGAVIVIIVVPVKIWFTALVSGAHISMKKLTSMKMRKLKMDYIVNSYIQAKKANLKMSVNEVETHYLAGGDIEKVINALIAARSAKFPFSYELAKAIDLAGKDVLHAVKQSITPRVIETDWVSATAKNEMELKTKARITLRANINRIIGGAGEDTILARVNESIVTTIGSASSHQIILENPDIISKAILAKKTDIGTAYDIISVDISEVNIGKNLGVNRIINNADTEKALALVDAEKRRARASVAEMEMKVKTQEMRAKAVATEVEITKAILEKVKEGKISITDFYKMQNINADTAMRNSLAGIDPNAPKGGTSRF